MSASSGTLKYTRNPSWAPSTLHNNEFAVLCVMMGVDEVTLAGLCACARKRTNSMRVHLRSSHANAHQRMHVIRYCGQGDDIARVVEGGFLKSKVDSLPRKDLLVLGYGECVCVYAPPMVVSVSLC
jgi:hypothetical protein